jgi:hypothetical protein
MPLPSLRQADTLRRRRGVQITPVGSRSLPGPYPYRDFAEEGGLVPSAVQHRRLVAWGDGW